MILIDEVSINLSFLWRLSYFLWSCIINLSVCMHYAVSIMHHQKDSYFHLVIFIVQIVRFSFFTVVFNVVLVAIVPFYFSSLVCLTMYQSEGMNKLLLKIRFNIFNSFFIMKILKSIWKQNRLKGKEINYMSNTFQNMFITSKQIKVIFLKNSQWRVKIFEVN